MSTVYSGGTDVTDKNVGFTELTSIVVMCPKEQGCVLCHTMFFCIHCTVLGKTRFSETVPLILEQLKNIMVTPFE